MAQQAASRQFRLIAPPEETEYPGHMGKYIRLVPADGKVLQHLRAGMEAVRTLLSGLPEARLHYRYAPGKWTLKEMLLHMTDTERIFSCRALCFARNEKAELPGFEQDDYAAASGAHARSLTDLLEEYATVREASLSLFNGLPREALTRSGTAAGSNISVRALAYATAGHELHHLNVIRQLYC
ncbi:DinB family protein [Compostibacter hankyongensis]|uniref:DinB family protein n=1 Tax=Compostibacter hankyongensis TaxID=1007089 RepID=A0ABP8G1X8_9BACT